MSDGLFSALSGAVSQERALDVIANNVANASTTGYKADRITFRQALSKADNDSPISDSIQYVAVSRVSPDASSGTLIATGNPLDVAIQGEGWFEIQTAQGPRYTRAGNFVTNDQGVLTTTDGHEVTAASGGSLVIPQDATRIEINRSGGIFVDRQEIGQIRLVTFEQNTPLEKEGLNLFRAKATPIEQPTNLAIVQGSLETSNVNAVSAMHELIVASRSFDAFQKVIDGFRHMDNKASRDLGEI